MNEICFMQRAIALGREKMREYEGCSFVLEGCVIRTSSEPCPICRAAIPRAQY